MRRKAMFTDAASNLQWLLALRQQPGRWVFCAQSAGPAGALQIRRLPVLLASLQMTGGRPATAL